MAADDDLLYNYEGITNISGAIEAFVGQMNGNLAEVDAKFETLLANGWTGRGADAFHDQKIKWHSAADDMATTLRTLSQKVGNAAITMQQVDAAAAARFAG